MQKGNEKVPVFQVGLLADMIRKSGVNALADITLLREAAYAIPLVRKGWKDEPTKVSALMEPVQDIVSSALTSAGVSHFYLTGANYVIHLDSWWSPAIEQQATGSFADIGRIKGTIGQLIICIT